MQLTCAVSVKQLLLLSLRLSSRERKLPEITINSAINSFKTAASILVISNNSSLRMLFDKIAFIFYWKVYLYFSTGNGQPREPALCQLYWHTFFPCRWGRSRNVFGLSVHLYAYIPMWMCNCVHTYVCASVAAVAFSDQFAVDFWFLLLSFDLFCLKCFGPVGWASGGAFSL